MHGHAKGEHRPFAEERPIAYSARMLFLWFYHACRRGSPRFLMVADHINYLTFEDPGAVNTVRRALKLAQAGDIYGAAETAGVEAGHAQVVSDALRRGMRFSIGAEADNDPRARPDAQNIVDAMRPDGIVRSVNFVTIDHPEKGADWAWAFDNEEFRELHERVGTDRLWELYIAKLLDDLEKLPANVVGHFYAPANLGGWPASKRLEEYEDRLLTVCHARGLAIEVNTRFLYRDNPPDLKKRYIDANTRLVRKAKALGVGIAVGSDAHSPKDQGNAFDVALKILDDAKINELVFPVGGRLARVALRATREHLEAQAKQKETSTPGSSISGFSRAELGLPEQAEVLPARRESARAAREAASKKRASGSTRSGKRAETATSKSGAAGKSTSHRTAESSTSSSKAKAARTAKPAPAKKSPPKPVVKPSKKAKPAKAGAKPAAAKTPSAKMAARRKTAKPAAKVKPAARKTAARAAKKKAVAKPARKAAAPKRTSAAARKVAAKKSAVKKRAAKATAKPKKPVRKKKRR